MTLSWIITLPFRGRPASDIPLATPESSVSPTLIPPYVPPAPEPTPEDLGFAYNVRRQPYKRNNSQLQEIVDELVNIAEEKGLPTGPLSISLIDVSNPEVHTFAGYKSHQHTLKFRQKFIKIVSKNDEFDTKSAICG